MKILTTTLAIGVSLLFHIDANAQGALAPTDGPAPTQKSLQEIWDKISSLQTKADATYNLIPNILEQMLPQIEGFVGVVGGSLPQSSTLAGQTVQSFYIGRTEVTTQEWNQIRSYANANGYDLASYGEGSALNHPVRNVSWHDVIKWCNAKSEHSGLTPVYTINGTIYKTGIQIPEVNVNSNGFRLPLEKEWEFAARGGIRSQGFTYSGGNDLNAVAWNMANSMNAVVDLVGGNNEGRGTFPVGQKIPNELGIYDMSGNVAEWCWDAYNSESRVLRGGSFWIWGYTSVADRYYDPAGNRNVGFGFRIVRGLNFCQ
jgi:sulfatase modifying factor 1